ncbi:MAG: hypothetical protein ACFBSF_10105 [Leptolyngbyaceae cyanobacterium]
MKPPNQPLKKKRCLLSKLWQLRHGPLNVIKIVELLIELPLAVPHCLLCAIAEGLKKSSPSIHEGIR